MIVDFNQAFMEMYLLKIPELVSQRLYQIGTLTYDCLIQHCNTIQNYNYNPRRREMGVMVYDKSKDYGRLEMEGRDMRS